MHIDKQDYGTGWYSIRVGISPKEIDALIGELQDLKRDPDQHFHISSELDDDSGISDIVIYVQEADENDNAYLAIMAILPEEGWPETGLLVTFDWALRAIVDWSAYKW